MCSLVPSKSSGALAASATAAGGASTGSTSTGTSTSGNSSSIGDDIVAYTWYAGWHGTEFPPDKLSWSKYTAVTYAFATTTNDVNTVSLADSDEELLPTFVDLAHQNNVKAILTIGGWTGSQYFSSAVATEANRTAFVKTVLNLVSKYDLDGLDFDWEYPNKQGMGCNLISDDDSQNFLSFLQALRADPAGQNLTLSAATGITPYNGPDGTPLSDVSAFAGVLDYIAIMNYDVWGSWSTSVGPNAPLNDTCASAADQQGSAVSAVAAWTAAGFPANQLVLGVASYGHSFKVDSTAALTSGNTLAAYPAFDAAQQPLGDSWDAVAAPGPDQCGVQSAGGPSGIFDFWGLIEGGFLTANGTVADGIDYRFDACSQTPYVYNPTSGVMVSYDDAESFAAKGRFINEAGLRGFAMWEAAGDSNDILLDAITNAIGIEEVDC
ncbi:glycoside hydrolase [Trametes versicolor FP-101664 SS1]|uniref:Glycoside hydrolase n=1 Tax=Trametes versicolor (strain FP-101664) TaxID=717944 RepID=R7S7Q1_TRAVS|nr:glycoside hydrolase [Trametes versicolor FP-101664 SS1]EIW51657.1 glycoside hydrolase [Trametes versicolor FP-101664 SS1]